mgnify:CR=1 FL=1
MVKALQIESSKVQVRSFNNDAIQDYTKDKDFQYDEGKVAIVQGVGYDQPSFSHFTSISFWHTASPNSGNEYGWIGRTASVLDPAGARANLIVNVSDSQSLAVKAAKHGPLVFIDPTTSQL